MELCTPQTAIEAIRAGRMVIVVDDVDRENEGDLVMAAECVTPEAINFMETHARGWVCVPLAAERLEALDLPLMVARSTERQGTAFTVTVDARRGTTTGISCEDQTATIRALVDERTQPSDLLRPGHVRPLRAQPGGVLVRAGHTEAAVDLARLAGLAPAGIICEIKNPDGSMARLPDLRLFAARHGLPILTIADLIEYRRRTEKLVRRVGTTQLPTTWGAFTAHGYESATVRASPPGSFTPLNSTTHVRRTHEERTALKIETSRVFRGAAPNSEIFQGWSAHRYPSRSGPRPSAGAESKPTRAIGPTPANADQ